MMEPFWFQMGLTMAQAVVDPQMLEACVRDVLNVTATRYNKSLQRKNVA